MDEKQIGDARRAIIDAADGLPLENLNMLVADVLARAALQAVEPVKGGDAAAYERAFDAAGAYLNEQYGNMALFNPIDRGRILATLNQEQSS